MPEARPREPASSPPLRWGAAGQRVALGLVLIIGSSVGIAGANFYVLWLLALGTAAHVAGWCLLPSTGWRRIVAAIISTPGAWLLLTGPRFIGVLVLPYLAWLIARHRPARSYLSVIFPIAGAFLVAQLFTDYSGMLSALGVEGAILVASAWIARLIASR